MSLLSRVFKRGMTSLHEELPRALKPLNYSIHCWNISHILNTFDANIKVNFDVKDSTNVITLNQKFLNFHKASVTSGQDSIEVVNIVKNDEKESVSFELASEVIKGQSISLDVNYEGVIRTDMAGFYSSNYTNDKGEVEYILATQFESTDARSAFPCYDEPNAKAQFDIKITTDSKLQVLSNMPLKLKETKGDLTTFEFDQSPKMSTYLVAWAIGKFEYVEGSSIKEYRGAKLPIRVYTIPGQSQSGEYALEVAQKAVDYLSVVFDIDYPLPKLDLLAVPQFGANAMENWGLVTFRATALLFDPVKSNNLYKQKVTYVVSHEIAHSWFGNYCTMDWWSDLWLNESFATYVGWLCVDHIHKEWDVFTEFVSTSVQTALDLDSLENSHPVEVQVYYANEIDEIFDHISYLKGGSVVRMVAESIGVELFLKGVSNYLKKYAFANAKSDDLWDAISEVSGVDVTKLVAPWIRSVGFPYLKAEKITSDEIKVTQSRFISNGDKVNDETVWWIPNVENMTTKDKIISSKDFLKLNHDTTGFYRVIYDDELFSHIVANLEKLSAKDKIGLIADTAAAAQAGLVKTSQFLELLQELKNENDESVWNQIVQRLNKLQIAFFSNKEISEELNKFAKALYAHKFEELIKTERELTFGEQKLRSLLFTQAGVSGLPSAISEAKRIYQAGNIEPIFKNVVYKVLLANKPTEELFNEVFEEAINPTSIDGRETALSALGCISDSQYFDKIFELLTNGSVPEMDFQFLTLSLASNPFAKLQFWDYFKSNFDNHLHKNVSMWTLDRVIKGFLPRLVSRQLYQDINTFFASKDTKGYEKGLLQGLDSISTSVKWYERSESDLSKWF